MKQLYFTLSLLAIGALIMMSHAEVDARQGFKTINDKGQANFIFASQAIGKGKEHTVTLKTGFTPTDKIYARGYFPGAVGSFNDGEKMHVHMWADGKRIGNWTYGSPPNARWDQMSLYLRNTGDDDFNGGMSRALDRLGSGSHTVKFYFVRDKFLKYKLVKKGNSVRKEPVYKPVYLTAGEFTYVVP